MAETSNNEDFPTRSMPGRNESDRPGDFPANPFELSKGDRIGDFEILGEIGQGGMGTVYKAHEVSLKRMVALKVLNPSIYSNPSLAKRFRREAILAANPELFRKSRRFIVLLLVWAKYDLSPMVTWQYLVSY